MVYLHIPFCGSFCTYCGFYSETESGAGVTCSAFADAMIREIRSRADEIAGSGPPDTIYIGGGTPSVLPLSSLSSVVSALREVSPGCGRDEFTVEVNPEDVVEKGSAYLDSLLGLGVSRISMGVQSLDDGVLRWMNRRHDVSTARKAYSMLREAGFSDISVDLIFGISFLDDEIWRKTLDEIIDGMGTGMSPEHLSAYQLSVEEGSALERLVVSGRYSEASEEKCRIQYDILCRKASDAGYRHYEISNFALPGHEAVHNSAYWRRVPYVGLGPSAHSLLHDGMPSVSAWLSEHGAIGKGRGLRVRCWNPPSLADYVRNACGSSPADHAYGREGEVLTAEQEVIETVMLALRTDTGISESCLRRIRPDAPIDALIDAGSLCREKDGAEDGPRLRIPEGMFFVSDSIISSLV